MFQRVYSMATGWKYLWTIEYHQLQHGDFWCVINEKKEYCFVLETFEKELNEQKMDYQFYFKCQKICQQFGIGQLEHANAILEQQKTIE